MQNEDIELNVIKRITNPEHMHFAVQTNYRNRVYVVSFKKYPETKTMSWGHSYDYASAVFLGNDAGDIEPSSPFVSSYENDPTEEMAVRYVKILLMEFIESDNE